MIQTIKTTLETPVSIIKTSVIYQETTTAQITKGEIPIQIDGEIPFFLKTFLIPFTTVELPSMTIEPITTAIQLDGEIPIQLLGEIPILVKSTKATSMTIQPRTTAIKLDGVMPIPSTYSIRRRNANYFKSNFYSRTTLNNFWTK